MKAIILAAGYGRRMRPLTDRNHKTLLEIGDQSIMERIISTLIACGIQEIVVVTGYLEEVLKSHIQEKFPDQAVQYVYNQDFAKTNNIYSMALALENIKIDGDILLIESDLIFDKRVIQKLLQDPNDNVALVDKYKNGMDGTVVEIVDNKIISVIPPHLQGANFDFSDKYKTLNIYKFSQEFASTIFKKLLTYYARVIDDNCYYELILGILIYMQQEEIHASIVEDERWGEVDTPNDLEKVLYLFDESQQLSILEKTYGGYWNFPVTDFCFIRNMYFPNKSILSEIKNNLANLLHNYGSKQSLLNQKLAVLLLCEADRVQLLNGASQVYPILGMEFRNKTVLVPSPTFGEYERIFDDVIHYSDHVGINPEEVADQSQSAEVIVFVNPNNPTGTVISTEWIYSFAQSLPQKTIIVDESFIEFSGQVSVQSLLEKDPLENVIVIKSLSKSLGVPGLRIGYCYSSNADFMGLVKKFTPIWNSNSIAEFFLEIVIKHRLGLEKSYALTIKDREDFAKRLRTLDIVEEVFESGGNFILIKLRGDESTAQKVAELLLNEHHTFVKNASAKFLQGEGMIRLAVRLPEENALLVEQIKEITPLLAEQQKKPETL